MRNYIILNNKSSNDINGLIIQELAPISKPQQRTQVETIDGRDGDIVTPLGYAAYNKKIKIGLYGDFDINEIIAYFATKGTAIFSNEPDKYYNYQILDQIDYERLVRFRVATVTMHVQPFKYSATEGTITVDSSDTVSGEGSNIVLENTAEAPFTTLRHKGNATQDTYSGKNLANYLNAVKATNDTTLTFVDNGFRQVATSAGFGTKLQVNNLTPSTTYILSWALNIVSAQIGVRVRIFNGSSQSTILATSDVLANGTGSLTFDTPADSTSVNVWFYNSIPGSGDTTWTYIQLEKSDSSSSYEPYVGGTASPNYDYPQDISVLTGESTVKITGKNLWDPDDLVKGYVNDNGTISTGGGLDKTTQFIPIIGGQSYTISSTYDGNTYHKIAQYDAQKNFIKIKKINSGASLSETTENNAAYIRASTYYGSETPPNIQLEAGDQKTDYEQYKGQAHKLNLGKNLLENTRITTATTTNGVTATPNADGSISLTGTASALTRFVLNNTLIVPAGTYTYSGGGGANSGISLYNDKFGSVEASKTITLNTPSTGNWSIRIASGTTTNITIYPQLEKGSIATPYAKHFTPIELVGIGDYADEPVKVGDTWYIRRAIKKRVFDGSENWSYSNETGKERVLVNVYDIALQEYVATAPIVTMCDYFIGSNWYNLYKGLAGVNVMSSHNTKHQLLIRTDDFTDAESFKTWLASHNMTVYYVLATPVDEEITEQALIDQLDELYDQAHAYKGRTHITANAQGDNAPAVLSVEVGENNESTVTNAGNTASRPIITIYGQGNIGMYINDVEVLDIALGDEQYITIDSVAMEAYKDTTENLKNRLVTGDYNKLALNAGDNKIYFTGKVTKYEISKYSRWL